MVIFLLIVIAIGVLLISDAGRELLGWVMGLGIIAVILLVMLGIALLIYMFSTTQAAGLLMAGVGWLIVMGLLIYLIYRIWKKLIAIWKDRKQIPMKIRIWWRERGKKKTMDKLRLVVYTIGAIIIVFGGTLLLAWWLAYH